MVLQMLGDLIQAHIRQLFEWVLPACLRFVRKNVKEIQPSLDTSLAISCMRLFNSMLDAHPAPMMHLLPLKVSPHCNHQQVSMSFC